MTSIAARSGLQLIERTAGAFGEVQRYFEVVQAVIASAVSATQEQAKKAA